jgi:SAM-dependent methyltransferase
MSAREQHARTFEGYDEPYAQRYRAFDDTLATDRGFALFSPWLAELSRSFGRPIDVLDLGCGTGRYFASLERVRELVGLDRSAAMLDKARTPIDADRITADRITLVCGDVATHRFDDRRFDLVYAIGVLAEHVALTPALVRRVGDWLAPGGLFVFTAVHPESPTVPRTWKRRLGGALMPLTFGGVRRWLHDRWCSDGLYADEARVRDVLAAGGLTPVSIRRAQSVHLHLLVVARRTDAA